MMTRISVRLCVALILSTATSLSSQQRPEWGATRATPEATVTADEKVLGVLYASNLIRLDDGAAVRREFEVIAPLRASRPTNVLVVQELGATILKDADTYIRITATLGGQRFVKTYPYGESHNGYLPVSTQVRARAGASQPIRFAMTVLIQRRTSTGRGEVRIDDLTLVHYPCPPCAVPPPLPSAPPPPPPPVLAPMEAPLPPVTNGTEVRGELPDVVAILGTAKKWCSGVLVEKRLVLTAAHCDTAGAYVYVADDARAPGARRVRVLKTREAILNAQSRSLVSGSLKDEPLMLVLESRVPDVDPRRLADLSGIANEPVARIAGFGYTATNASSTAGVKRSARVSIRSPACMEPNVGGRTATAAYGCMPALDLVAGGDGVDTCYGDSGGPLFLPGPNKAWLLAALTSRGVNGADCGGAGVYMRLDHYREWIATLQALYK